MRLTHRLALGTIVLVGTVVGGVVLTADRRLSARLFASAADELGREASFVAAQWTPRADPVALAATACRTLRHRVTLIDTTGRVVGDALFTEPALARLENHAARPEVVQARATGQGQLFPVLVPLLGWLRGMSGRLADSAELLDGAIEAARLADNRQALAWALFNRAMTALHEGDLDAALLLAQESADLTREPAGTMLGCFSGLILGMALVESGSALFWLNGM